MTERRTESVRPAPEDADLVLVVSGARGTREVPLPRHGELRIGRSPECEVVLDDASVSRIHARLRRSPLSVEDAGSRHGTTVLGRRIAAGERALLMLGTVVQIGSTSLLLRAAERRESDDRVVIEAPAMKALHHELGVVAASQLPVLLLGETGTGKEVLAREVHDRSPRAGRRFLTVNCAALSESLLESELFGYVKGAFTGANATKEGLFEAASGGTFFLDEVGELPAATQAKLLRVLEVGEVLRIGSTMPIRVDVRFVSATNRDLRELARTARFREDLYFRLAGHVLRIPPLRERREEVVPLARMFLARASARTGITAPALGRTATEALEAHPWPGNVRELRNAMERAVAFAQGRAVLEAPDLQLESVEAVRPVVAPTLVPPPPKTQADMDTLRASVASTERDRIVDALAQTGGNQTEAAKVLGIARRTLINKIEALGIPRPRKG